jgi:hypothetical protein
MKSINIKSGRSSTERLTIRWPEHDVKDVATFGGRCIVVVLNQIAGPLPTRAQLLVAANTVRTAFEQNVAAFRRAQEFLVQDAPRILQEARERDNSVNRLTIATITNIREMVEQNGEVVDTFTDICEAIEWLKEGVIELRILKDVAPVVPSAPPPEYLDLFPGVNHA